MVIREVTIDGVDGTDHLGLVAQVPTDRFPVIIVHLYNTNKQ